MSAEQLLARRLRVRPEVLFGRPLLCGTGYTHRIKDTRSGRAFAVGAREHFVLTRLDGERTLAEIGVEYAATFGKRLAEPHWVQLITLLASRDLLAPPAESGPASPDAGPVPPNAGPASPDAGPVPPDAEPASPDAGPASPDAGPVPPDAGPASPDAEPASPGTGPVPPAMVRVVEAVYRLVRPALNRWLVLSLLAVAATTVTLLGTRLPRLADGAGWLAHRPLALAATVAWAWFCAALHELGHGIAALRHGCRVTRVSLATLHCQVDEYLYLRSAPAQLAVAGAGTLVNALLLVPAAVAWSRTDAAGPAHAWLGGLLLVGWLQTVVNLVPVPPLDGYKMLGHAMGVADLAGGSARFVRLLATGLVGHGAGVRGYRARARAVYTGYALISAAVGGAACAGAILAGQRLAQGRAGATGVVLVIVAATMTLAGWLAGPAGRRGRPGQDQGRRPGQDRGAAGAEPATQMSRNGDE